MPREFFYPYPNDDWNQGVSMQEYNGVLSLVAGGKSAEGGVYMKWCFPQKKDKSPTEKAIPMKVTLGNDREAVAMLKYFLSQLTNGDSPLIPKTKGGKDIPF